MAHMVGIELLFRGYSSVKWIVRKTERDENGKQQAVQIPYESDEMYHYSKSFVYGNAYYEKILSTGEYTFKFSLKLPCFFPSSFEGEFGFVRHDVTVMTFPKLGNAPVTFPIQITNASDYILKPSLEIPVNIVDEQNVCGWCCSSGHVSCSLYIPARGFHMRQQMPIIVDVNNHSNTSVAGVTIVLQRVDTFVATQPERETKKSIQNLITLQLDPVPRRKSKRWQRNIMIPDGPPSGLKYCAIISLEYFVCVNVTLSPPHKDMVAIKTPVILGKNPSDIIAQDSACSILFQEDAMKEKLTPSLLSLYYSGVLLSTRSSICPYGFMKTTQKGVQ